MSKKSGSGYIGQIVVIIILLLLLLTLGVLIMCVAMPYVNAKSTMPDTTHFEISMREDGTSTLSWDAVPGVDSYIVEISDYQSGETVFSGSVNGSVCLLPALDESRLILRVSSVKYCSIFGTRMKRLGEESAQVTFLMHDPCARELTADADAVTHTIALSWQGYAGDNYKVYKQGDLGVLSLLEESGETSITLNFDGETLTLPDYDETVTLVVEGICAYDGITLYGTSSVTVGFTREDFLPSDIELRCTENGGNSWTLLWSETQGDTYTLEMSENDGDWQTVLVYERGDTLSYSTGQLPPFNEYKFRVSSTGGKISEDESVISNTVSVETEPTPVGCLVWTVKPVYIYSGVDKKEIIGETGDSSYCVLSEDSGMFYVRFGGGYGYIDSSYCMINLPDYFGDLCAYDITNSYASLFTIHEYEIKHITGRDITGYENVRLGYGEYLVPLLYPTAEKLLTAALAARDDGYRIKITDAFRPQTATYDLYDWTDELLDEPVPDYTYSGIVMDDLPDIPLISEIAGDLPEDTDWDTVEQIEYLKYSDLLSGGIYTLSDFFENGSSTHNMGIALDVTLEWGGEEVKMQTSMHDVSCYSEILRNNWNAELLSGYMSSAGFNTSSSKWWHFEDNASAGTLNLAYRLNGVSAEGWYYDGTGFRYRRSTGAFYTDCRVTIDGSIFEFGTDGYVIE